MDDVALRRPRGDLPLLRARRRARRRRGTALFADDATVVDERETHHGRAAIRAWRVGPASRFAYTTEILRTESDDPDRHVVTARLTGNFPGSTVVLRHDFTLAGERIARLVIAP